MQEVKLPLIVGGIALAIGGIGSITGYHHY